MNSESADVQKELQGKVSKTFEAMFADANTGLDGLDYHESSEN